MLDKMRDPENCFADFSNQKGGSTRLYEFVIDDSWLQPRLVTNIGPKTIKELLDAGLIEQRQYLTDRRKDWRLNWYRLRFRESSHFVAETDADPEDLSLRRMQWLLDLMSNPETHFYQDQIDGPWINLKHIIDMEHIVRYPETPKKLLDAGLIDQRGKSGTWYRLRSRAPSPFHTEMGGDFGDLWIE